MTVLIAEDDRVLAQLLAARIGKLGLRVQLAFDAMQTHMLALRSNPSVIILDISMPGGNGIEVLRKLKASARTSLIPVIVVSGSVDASMRETVLGLGAEEFFPKPPDFDALRETLERILAAGKPLR